LVFKRSLESLILESKWSEALSLITSFELQHGTASLIKELSIAITQQSEGTVKQVAFSRKIEAQCVKNAFPHFIRFASERNEDRLTLSGFRRNFRETYKSTADEPLVYAVIQWHALHQLPYKEELLSQLLSFEGSGSIFDYFETFIAIATEIATRFSHNYRTTLKNCLKRFSEIDDQRIVNLTRILEYQYTSSVSPLTATNVLSEIRARAGRNGVMSAIETTVFRLLEAPLPNGDDRRTIHKLSANFYHLDFFKLCFTI